MWVTRIVNAWTASDESAPAKTVSTVVAAALLVLALGVVRVLFVARQRPMQAGEITLTRVLVGATVAVWAVRVPQILLDAARDVPFKTVHCVLAVISLVLAALTWRVTARETGSTPAGPSGATPISTGAKADR